MSKLKIWAKKDIKYFKTVFEKATAGTYSLNLPAGYYYVELYGAGGGWANSNWTTDTHYCRTSGGGSGACFKGIIHTTGAMTVTVGAGGKGADYFRVSGSGENGGATSINNIVSAGGGQGAYSTYLNSAGWYVGAGGAVSILNSSAVVKSITSSIGKDGSTVSSVYTLGPSTVAGGLSLYNNTATGYGAGGGYPNEAIDGYIRIMQQTTADDYEVKDETITYKLPKINEKYYAIKD